ncbi:putative RNA-directed DNA polymerase [Helianthus annuus]|nr:putative RNA-directed DNA polymerase [Helianthus annuus]
MFKPSKSSRPFNFQSYLKNRSGFRSCDRCRGITYQLTHSNPLMNQQPPSPTQPQQQTSPPSQQQQQQAQTPPPPHSQQPPLQPHHLQQQPQQPNLPCFDLVRGSREEYLKIGVPLYEASIKCNWKAAEAILDKRRELVGYSITENGETPLHVAASAKGDPKRVEEFVKNLVGMMTQKQLELQNKNYNTALYLAAAAGNVETVKIMVKENRKLLTIIGSNKTMMPLYAAALFGNKDVVAYIYEESKSLSDDENWSRERRGWLLEKCVENNMFEVALKIAKKHPLHDNGRSILRILARKPERFQETKSNFMGAAIKSARPNAKRSLGVSGSRSRQQDALKSILVVMSSENNSSFALKSILEKDKLNNTNFLEWHRNLRIVLKMAKRLYVLETPIPTAPENNTVVAKKAFDKHKEDAMEVACLMQATMSPDLQKNMEDMNAFDMIEQLKGMFQKQARQERYDTMKQLISCKMQEGSSVSAHVLKMKGYIDQLNKLGYPLQDEMAVDFILNSLSSHYDQFVMNFNMNDWVKTVPELHGMLKTAEMNISNKVSQVLMVRSGGVKKPKTKKKSYNSKNKGNAPVAAKPATNKSKQAVTAPLPEERQCYECNKMGHWKRNCPEYLAKLKVKKANGEGTSSGA